MRRRRITEKLSENHFHFFTECKTLSFKNQRNTEVKCMWLGVVHRCVYLCSIVII